MLPSRVYETAPVARELTGTGLDAKTLRERTRLSSTRIGDAEFADRIVAACNLIEQQTGLRLFAGTYTAEWDVVDLIKNRAWIKTAFEVPGTNAVITALSIGELTITPRQTVFNWNLGSGRSAGNNGAGAALPPFDGWPVWEWTAQIYDRINPIATFTAGGALPPHVASAVASQVRMEHMPTAQEAALLDYYLSKIRMR